nr:isoleucine--tRNA ligase, cytoplasmic [Tanacetum cinerariifolium]
RLGKSMKVVGNAVKAMSQDNILSFEKAGEITIAGHCLKLTDIKIVTGFKRPDGVPEEQMDASSDGDVLVIMDLRTDDSLLEAGFAREIVNRIQKLRKKSALEPTYSVEVYFSSLYDDPSVSARILQSQEACIKEALGSPLLDISVLPNHAVVIAEETYKNIVNCDFKITLSRSAIAFNEKAILELYSGNAQFAKALQVYLRSRLYGNLKSEFQVGNGKIKVDCIENLPAVDVVLWKHVFLTTGDYHASQLNLS